MASFHILMLGSPLLDEDGSRIGADVVEGKEVLENNDAKDFLGEAVGFAASTAASPTMMGSGMWVHVG